MSRNLMIAMVLLAAAPVLPSGRAQTAVPPPAPSQQTMPPAPPADDPTDKAIAQPAIRLSAVDGAVHLSDSTGKVFDQVLVNMAVLPGMTLETGGDGRAELEFPDGSVARVAPNSALALAASGKPGDSADGTHLTLEPQRGLTYFELAPASSYGIQVGPLTARTAPTGQEQVLLRVNLDQIPYLASVLRGSIHFEDASGNAAYDLPANETARIDPVTATNYDIQQDVAADTWDAWNSDRDAARAQVASATPAAGTGNAGPGWEDLNYYGSWYDVPGQGMAWAPDGVDASFDPYGSGSWGFYTGVGYGWVSAYPWGWLPYHCGLWNYYPAYGWMWLPSNCGWGRGAGYGYGEGWYPYSGVRNAPGFYRLPHRPMPPGGTGRKPLRQALIAVDRGTPAQFRTLGGARPVARTLVVSGTPVRPLPAEARPSYNSFFTAGQLRTMRQGTVNSVQPGFVAPARAGATSGLAPHVVAIPGPRYNAPAPAAPRMSAPPAMPAPHASAPSAPAGGGGHGH